MLPAFHRQRLQLSQGWRLSSSRTGLGLCLVRQLTETAWQCCCHSRNPWDFNVMRLMLIKEERLHHLCTLEVLDFICVVWGHRSDVKAVFIGLASTRFHLVTSALVRISIQPQIFKKCTSTALPSYHNLVDEERRL